MDQATRIHRAGLLLELRAAGRLPAYLTPERIRAGFAVGGLIQVIFSARDRRLIERPIGICAVCRRTSRLGCAACFAGAPWSTRDPLEQVRELRRGRGSVYPGWLWDSVLARAYCISRHTVRRMTPEPCSLCTHCGRPAESRCLRCLAIPIAG